MNYINREKYPKRYNKYHKRKKNIKILIDKEGEK